MIERCCVQLFLFFCKQKAAYEVRISDWSSDLCSSDLTTEYNVTEEAATERRSWNRSWGNCGQNWRRAGSKERWTTRICRRRRTGWVGRSVLVDQVEGQRRLPSRPRAVRRVRAVSGSCQQTARVPLPTSMYHAVTGTLARATLGPERKRTRMNPRP